MRGLRLNITHVFFQITANSYTHFTHKT